jgi:hypothetical protein
MLFLVELDRVNPGTVLTPESGRAFIENVIFPTSRDPSSWSRTGVF